jgi:hypothetical protein
LTAIAIASLILAITNFSESRFITNYKDNAYVDPATEEFIIVGEIQNDSCRSIHNVSIGIKFYDANNVIVDDLFIPISLNENKTTVVGDAKLPFVIKINREITQKVSSYEFYRYKEGEHVEKEKGLSIISSGIKLIESNSTMKYVKWNISGQIKNDSDHIAKDLKVIAALYGEDGRVVGVAGNSSYDNYPRTLLPKETKLFALEALIPTIFDVKSFYVYADSENISFKIKNPCWPPVFVGSAGTWVNEKGEAVEPIVGEKRFVAIDLLNQVSSEQNITYYLQIKDEYGFTVHLSWIRDMLQKDKTLQLRQEWVPNKIGEYTIEILVWSSEDHPMPLSPMHVIELYVDR